MNKINLDGMPKIAEHARKNKAQIVFVVAALMLILGYYFLKPKAVKEVEPHIEESFTLKSDVGIAKSPPVTSSVTENNKSTEQPVNKEMVAAQMAFVQQKQQELQQRLAAPIMLVNNSAKEGGEQAVKDERFNDANPNSQFLQNSSQKSVQTAAAVVMGSLSSIVAAGNFIHAILEPATNSDLPGSLRAIVSEPVYSEDGSQVLVPRGSRLIGEYKSGMIQGQSRIFIVWQRLLTPEGISVQLGSSGVDSLGVSGVGADSIDRHFWERFGTASLLSMLGAGAATAGVSGSDQDNSASSYRTAMANSFSQSASQSLQTDGSMAPTLRTMQGKPIMVFVARDLQFDAAIKNAKPSINIF